MRPAGSVNPLHPDKRAHMLSSNVIAMSDMEASFLSLFYNYFGS